MRYLRYVFLAGLALIASVAAPSYSFAERWEMLGEQSVGFRADRDVIRVGRTEGRFERLKLRVLRNDIELLDARVVYGNGEVDELRVRQNLREGTETRPFDLPGFRGRFIDRIELTYRSRLNFEGRAVVQVWGDPARDGDRGDDRGDRGYDRGGDRGDRGADRGDRGYDRGGDRGERRHYEWEKLGERKVGLLGDHDVVRVGRSEGKFRKLKLRVRGNSIQLYDVKVVYANGEVDHIRTREHIREGGETGALDLTGRNRAIERVELTYERQMNFRGSAYVEVWGLQVDD